MFSGAIFFFTLVRWIAVAVFVIGSLAIMKDIAMGTEPESY